MKNKKLFVLALSSLLMLTGCTSSDIEAKPTFIDDKIVDTENDLTHNTMSVIWDALKDSSSTKSKVLDKVLLALAKDYFGDYKDALAFEGATGVTEEMKAFFNAHEYYKTKDKDGNDVYTDEVRLLKLQSFIKDVKKRINNAYYDEISGGSYSYRNRFDEEKYAEFLKSQLYVVTDAVWHKDVLVTKAYKDDVSAILHLDSYVDYTERHIMPTIYKELIVEEYMYQENYPLLTRSNARKIKYIKLQQTGDEYPTAARELMIAFANRYIEKQATGEDKGVMDLELISEAWAGHPNMSAGAKQLLDDAGFEKVEYPVDSGKYYYPATSYGKVIEDYKKITDSRYNTENESTFTGDNTYPKEVGLQMKTDEVALEDYVTEGWYNSTDKSSVPSKFSERLFELEVANEVDHTGVTVNSETGEVESEDATVAYVAGKHLTKKNGIYWLVPEVTEKDSVDKFSYIFTEKGDNPTYYMVMVEEAVNSAKLSTNKNNRNNYAHLRGGESLRKENGFFTESVAREITKLYNSNETYRKQSYVKILKDASIKYHDQSVYDYFKDNYPELFEDD